jgi:acylphosphatase
MRRLTAYISGKIQRAGYRGKVVTIARAFGLRGNVQNLPDGRVKVVAEGEEADLERFADALVIKNAIIDVTSIEKQYDAPTNVFDGFGKIVDEGETDARLDSAVDHLKKLIELSERGLNKQDQMLDRQDQMLAKQDQMLGKMDLLLGKQDDIIGKIDEAKSEIITEIKELRADFRSSLEERLSRIESDLAQVKAKIGI